MKVAGLGFRRAVTVTALREALEKAGGPEGLSALATAVGKTDAPALCELADGLGLPIRAIAPEELAGAPVEHDSARVTLLFGTGSLAEAAALCAAGRGARLIVGRVVSTDGMATAAVAQGEGP